jgi:hypothetical protein
MEAKRRSLLPIAPRHGSRDSDQNAQPSLPSAVSRGTTAIPCSDNRAARSFAHFSLVRHLSRT